MRIQFKVSKRLTAKFSTAVLIISGLVFIAGSLLPGASQAVADSIQDQINSLTQQNSDTANIVDGLQAQAASYQDAINQLQGQISALQSSINDNLAKQASLQQQITEDQNEITQEKGVLADDVKTMYVDGTPSTLEVLATSKNLSDFVDKQEYRTSVQNKLQDTLEKIAKLQAQLQSQKTQVDQLLGQQQFQQNQLSSDKAQQASLLSYNQGQQATYNAQITANSSKISQLRAQQAAENAQLGTGLFATGDCGGGYPTKANSPWGGSWGCNYAQDNTVDNWDMYNRECVSYTAFRVYEAYGYNAIGWGNANEWPGSAQASGITVNSTEAPGTVAIWDVGAFGHAMWVEAVNGDGSIIVSQFNYSYNGTYSEMKVSAAQAATFHYIHFR
ncbi:MAG TPA: CHAP domain-containing protein [Candidatus Saccharimonadales bacterium]|jgi:surface antigen